MYSKYFFQKNSNSLAQVLGRSKAAIHNPLVQKEVFRCLERMKVVFKPPRIIIMARLLCELVDDQVQQGNPTQHGEL